MSDPALQSEPARVTYAFDAYCGWCYGFSPAMHTFVKKNAHRIAVQVLSGGLFTGERVQPVSQHPHIPKADARIAEITGVTFGKAYEHALREGTTVLNSVDPAKGLYALRTQDGVNAVHAAEKIQQAWFVEGRSLSDEVVYGDIARSLGIDADAVIAAYNSPDAQLAAEHDMQRVREMGVRQYPTLLLRSVGENHLLGDSTSSADDLTEALNRYI